MQGGQEPGRGIYIVRRILVVLVVLLLLILLVPRACEAILGPGEEQSSEAPETADVEEEETVTEEEAAPVQEEITEREEVAVSVSEEEEEAGEEEDVGAATVETVELEAPLAGPVTGFGGIPGGGAVVSVPQAVPPVVGTGVPEPIPPPPAPQEPALVSEPLAPAPIPPVQQPTFVEEPVFPGEPLFFGEPFFFGEPLFFAEPVVFEQPAPPVEEPPDSRTAAGGGVGATAQAGNAFASS